MLTPHVLSCESGICPREGSDLWSLNGCPGIDFGLHEYTVSGARCLVPFAFIHFQVVLGQNKQTTHFPVEHKDTCTEYG